MSLTIVVDDSVRWLRLPWLTGILRRQPGSLTDFGPLLLLVAVGVSSPCVPCCLLCCVVFPTTTALAVVVVRARVASVDAL